MSKTEAKAVKSSKVKSVNTEEQTVKNVFVRGIIGIVLMLVFASIAIMTVVCWTGSDSTALKIATTPAAAFDVIIAFVAFSKILK